MIFVDKLRTRMRDLLFGRTKIQFIDPVDKSDEIIPCFIIGTFRSGTTFFRYLLDSHSEICSPPETKYLVHFAEMMGKKSTQNAFSNMGFDEFFVRRQILDFANAVFGGYLKSKGASLLVDKTPEYTRILDFLDWLYQGRCKFLLIFRNGLDVTRSMMSVNIEPLEADKTVDTAFEYWKADTETMLQWETAHPDRCYRILYDELCDDTEGVLCGVMDFMGLEFEPAQLRWYEKEHTQGAEDIKARRQRKVNKSMHTYGDWSEETIQDLLMRAASLHQVIGYDPVTLERSTP